MTDRASRTGDAAGCVGRQSRWLGLLTLAVIVGVAVHARAFQLADRSLWFDEAYTWRLSKFSPGEVIRRSSLDNYPPLYFLVLKGWCALFGETTEAMRALSVICGAAAGVGMYGVAREIVLFDSDAAFSRRPEAYALLTAAIVALAPLQVRWGWEVRMYAMGAALAAFASWSLLRALREARAVMPWCFYVGFAVAFAYTHLYALLTIAAHAIFVVGNLLVQQRAGVGPSRLGPQVRRAVLAFGAVAVGFLPWAPSMMRQAAQVKADFWSGPLSAADVAGTCGEVLVGPGVGGSTNDAVAAVLFCALSLVLLLRRAKMGDWFLFASVSVPFALALGFSAGGRNIVVGRYFVFAQLFFLAAVARLVTRVRWPAARLALAMVLLLSCALACADLRRRSDVVLRPGARGQAAYLDAHRRPGEPIVVRSPLLYFPVRFHLADRRLCYLLSDGREWRHFEGGPVFRESDMISPEELTLTAAPRVWVIDGWGNCSIPLPSTWREVSRETCPDVHAFQGSMVRIEFANDRREPIEAIP